MATVNNTSTANGIDYSTYNVQTNTAKSNAQDIQDRFLKLLTTQLKTQDPSNPMDNAQMTSQMAQISTVSGLENVNASVKALTDNQNASQSLLATLMIGRSALVNSGSVNLSGGAAKAVVDFPQSVTEATVTIRNASGTVLNEMKLGGQKTGQMTLSWDGKDAKGVAVADGDYAISIKASNGATAVDARVLSPTRISSVAIDKGVASLVLDNGKKMSMSDIAQII